MMPARATTGKQILFAWEAGANLGHIMPLMRLASALEAEGHAASFAVRDLLAGATALRSNRGPLLQSPIWPPHVHEGNEDGAGGYQDVLALLGFGDARKLSAMLRGWHDLLRCIGPDLIVAEHSPALQALALAMRLPLVVVGTHFTVPPVVRGRFPPLRGDRTPLLPDRRLFDSLKEALERLGLHPAADNLPGALFPQDAFALGLHDLDSYAGFRTAPILRPLEPSPELVPPPDRPRLFAYLGGELPGLADWVRALARTGIEVECYLRDAPRALGRFLEATGAIVHAEPPDLAEVLPRVSHVVCQGGAGLCQAALLAGRPVAILPLHGEAERNLASLERLGMAVRLASGGGDEAHAQALSGFVSDHRLIVAALSRAAGIAQRDQPDGLSAIVGRIGACLSAPASTPAA